MERVEGRKSVLTAAGEKNGQQLLHCGKSWSSICSTRISRPAQIKENALRALSAGFSDQFMERLAEQEGRMRLKGRSSPGTGIFTAGDICNYLKDGSYYFPFIIYREQIKNHNNLSMANRGFENPCELIVKDHEGLVYLAVKTVSAESMSSGKKMEGRVNKMQYLYDGEFRDGGIDGRYVYFPVTALNFIAMGKGPGHPAPRQRMPENAVQRRDIHMPESSAILPCLSTETGLSRGK